MAALAKYKYLGLSSVVEVDYPEPEVKLDLWGQTPGSYSGLDRFGRIVDHRWINYGATPDEDVARIQHGYDRNSNRLWRQNDVARGLSKKFDQQYTYDGLNRLVDAKTGLLNGSHVIPPGSDTTFEQKWSLDYVGNWSCLKQDDDGDGDFDLEQTRTANQVNEITDIGASTGPVWTTPQYDPAGNTTNFPKPAAPTESFTAVYDAWNRMVKVTDDEAEGDTVQENIYDGRNFRIVKKSYDEGVLDETRHAYFTSGWRDIEERLGTEPDSADPKQQLVWGHRYIDDLVLRERDTSEPLDGTLDERVYSLQDGNWSISSVVTADLSVVQRQEFDAYGASRFYTSMYAPDANTLEWEFLKNGHRTDYLLGLLYARRRLLHVTSGTWLTRDPLQYVNGFNLYVALSAEPISSLDPFGTETVYGWKHLKENQYCATEEGARLEDLAAQIIPDKKSWPCLWPIFLKNGTTGSDGLYAQRQAHAGDIYDASNLEGSTPGLPAGQQQYNPTMRIIFSNPRTPDAHLQLMKAFTGFKTVYSDATDLASFIRDMAYHGRYPIASLTLVSHAGIRGLGLGFGILFELGRLAAVSQSNPPDLLAALQQKGPPRCWFMPGATVRFLGCNSNVQAKIWGSQLLRNGRTSKAKAWGTTQFFGINADTKKGAFGTEREVSAFDEGATWVDYDTLISQEAGWDSTSPQ